MKALCITSRSCSVLLDPDGLYEAREKHVLMLDGEEIGFPTVAASVEPMREENVYRVITDQGEDWYVVLVWESDETGWKVKACYDNYV